MLVGSFLKFVLLLCNKLQFSRLSSTNGFFSFTNFEALFTKFTLFSVTIFTTCRKENCLDVNKLARPESLIRGYLEWQRLVRADCLLQVVNQVQIILLCVELGTYTSLVQKSVLVTTYLLNVHKKYSTLNYYNLLFVSKAQRNEILF